MDRGFFGGLFFRSPSKKSTPSDGQSGKAPPTPTHQSTPVRLPSPGELAAELASQKEPTPQAPLQPTTQNLSPRENVAQASVQPSASGRLDTTAKPPHAHSPLPALVPGRSRIEVVVNVTPSRRSLSQPQPQQYEDDLEDDVLVKSDIITPVRRRGQEHQNGLTKESPHPSASPVRPAATPTTRDATSASASAEPQKRKRSRPKGLSNKRELPTASAHKHRRLADGEDVPKSHTGHKRGGRPPRKPSPTPRGLYEKMEPPKYVPFLCEWDGCAAELMNLETLRKHVRKVHGRADPLVCKWGRCGRQKLQGGQGGQDGEDGQDGQDGGSSSGRPPTFDDTVSFEEHVEERHLVPFAWHLGDGFRNEVDCVTRKPWTEDPKAPLPDYLFDESGNQVTPSVRDQELEDLITWRNNRRRLRQLLVQRDENAPFEDEVWGAADPGTIPL